jgi:hypothetical protein
MAKKSGISVELITKIGGISAQSITNLGGIAASTIPGWPSAGGCVTLILGHSPTVMPGMVCMVSRANYQFDSTNRILYDIGEPCGGTLAPNGFYSDGMMIYRWKNSTQTWEIFGACRR